MHTVRRVVKSFKLKQHQEYRYFWSLRHSCMLCVKYGLFLLRQILDILHFAHLLLFIWAQTSLVIDKNA